MKGKVLLYVIVVLVGVSFWLTFRKPPYADAVQVREIATRVLAEELARRHPNTAALVISNPFAQRRNLRKSISAVEDAGIRGLKEGFGQAVKVSAIDYPPIRPEAVENPLDVHIPDTSTPLSFLMADDAFDQMAQAHPDCDVIVSLVGLPAHLEKVELWKGPGPPHFGLLLPDLQLIGNVNVIRTALNSGKLAAFILPKPGAVSEQVPVTKDYHVEFDERFFLVTKENFEEIVADHPQLFQFRAPRR